MKKILSSLLILCMALSVTAASAGGAAPRFRFESTVIVSFQGREATARVQFINPNGVGHDVEAELRDENGYVLATRTFTNNKVKSVTFTFPDDWIGAKYLSVWADGEKVSEEDLFFAVDDINNKAIRQVGVSTQRMSITLDCGYGDTYTDRILDLLDELGIKVTFFVTGLWAENFPEHMKDIISRGHEIGNHSYYHPHLTEESFERVLREIVNTSDLVEEITGQRPVLFRPPYGDTDHLIRAISRAAGCEHIIWTVDSHDWDESYDAAKIERRVTNTVEPGYIILFHNAGKHTLEVLGEVIPYYQSLGYELVPVSTLLSEGEYTVNADGLLEFVQD
ncbi:MAG: polysaccharide deacetylase family protein [Clostridiales bacterium]|nr:polysaccharide deacetylase family protein [Clostridiales bacterium]